MGPSIQMPRVNKFMQTLLILLSRVLLKDIMVQSSHMAKQVQERRSLCKE
ncbi:unnamed protein product [Hymenolepis diminuta]|uniref:Uncharacterized protein n=1 Tax=Hymenolepis diminuta TaxID=6216 RepID=A0A564ZEF9_HYMDI|nr:unnamed protein product [Hymenolepis diminuta]